MSSRYLPVAAACSLVALASSSAPPTSSIDAAVSTSSKMGRARDDAAKTQEYVVQASQTSATPKMGDPNEDDASWRSSEEWWKDPLAYFDDDEEDDDDNELEEELEPVEELEQIEEFPEEEEEELFELESDNDEFYLEQLEEEPRQENYEKDAKELEQDHQAVVEEEEKEEEVDQEEEEKEEEKVLEVDEEESEQVRRAVNEVEINKALVEQHEREDNTEVTETSELPLDIQKRLAKNSMAMEKKQQESSKSVETPASTNKSFSAASAFLLPIAPKIRTFVSSFPAAAQFLGAAAVAGALFPLLNKGQQGMAQWQQQQQLNRQQPLQYDDFDDPYDERTYDNMDNDSSSHEQQQEEHHHNVETSPSSPSIPRVRPTFGLVQRMANMVPLGGSRQRIPSAKQLLEERDALLQRAQAAEAERDNMEREYEKTSWQLQEVQTDLQAQASTTRYLKAQLRDNEQMMDRAIRAERSRAKEELKRMKEAMLRVLERERQAMRDEVKRQSAELQALLEEANGPTAPPHHA